MAKVDSSISLVVIAPKPQYGDYCNPCLKIRYKRCVKNIVLPMPMTLEQRSRLCGAGYMQPILDISDSRLDRKLRLCVAIGREIAESLVQAGSFRATSTKAISEMLCERYREESKPIFNFMQPIKSTSNE